MLIPKELIHPTAIGGVVSKTVALGSRVDADLKAEFDETAIDLGLTPSAALTVLMKRFVDEEGFPFEVKRFVPNKEEYEARMLSTLEAMRSGKETVHELVEV